MEILDQITNIIVILIIILLAITYRRNIENNRQKRNVVLACIGIVCFIGGEFLVGSQYLIKFNSPEAAYMYVYLEKNPTVVEGRKTAMVIGKNNSILLERDRDGWRIPETSSDFIKCDKTVGTIKVYAIQHNFSEEYYLRISDSRGIQLEIIDNQNTKFYMDEWENPAFENMVIEYWGYVHNLDEDYTITVDGQKIDLIK